MAFSCHAGHEIAVRTVDDLVDLHEDDLALSPILGLI